jgi:hypothetical protein
MGDLQSVGKLKFDRSHGTNGRVWEHELELFNWGDPLYFQIEFVAYPKGDEDHDGNVHHAGIVLAERDGKRVLVDYDGVYELSREAITLLTNHGIYVPVEFDSGAR